MNPEEATRVYQNGLFFQASATTVVVYDHVTTFDLEVELIWKKKWSLVKILYLINRYGGDALLLYGTAVLIIISSETEFNKLCPSFDRAQTWLSTITLWAMQGIMIHRIVSMYRNQRKIIYIMIAAFLIECIALIITAGLTNDVHNLSFRATQSMQVCVPTDYPSHWAWSNWLIMGVFDLLVFVLALHQALQYVREAKRLESIRKSSVTTSRSQSWGPAENAMREVWSRHGTLMRILLRDSIIFPLLGVLLCITTILAWLVLPVGAIMPTLTLGSIGSPILGCRLILNLRDAYYQPFAEEIRHTMSPDDVFELPAIGSHHRQSHSISLTT